MNIDCSGADVFLSSVDDEVPLSRVWNHPAYELTREHAAFLGQPFTQDDLSSAIDGDETAFGGLENLAANRERIEWLLEYVRDHETAWTDRIGRELERLTPNEDISDVTLYLGIGYNCGIGGEHGAYINLNESLFHRSPRQVLYTAIHECSHVLYEREHRSMQRLEPASMDSRAEQWRVWNTAFHSEAYDVRTARIASC